MSTAPPAVPVHELMERHRALCEGAAGPLEIAAHLEPEGFGPRTARARTRHSDVFPLAEELFARVPRAPGVPRLPPVAVPWRALARTALCTGAGAAALLLLRPSLWGAVLLCLPPALCLAVAAGAVPVSARGSRRSGLGVPGAVIAVTDLAVLAAGVRRAVALVVLLLAAQAVAWGVAAVGRRHLLARSRSDFRSRMSAVLALGLVVDAAAAATAGEAQPACAGLLLALCLLLWALGYAVPALLGAAVGAAEVLIRAPVGWGLAPVAVLTAAVWALALRPESYRDELPVPL